MRRDYLSCLPLALCVFTAACGGPQIPQHDGYKTDKVKPWKKPKVLAFDDKKESKSDGDLSYADFRRAKWFAIDLPTQAELTYRLEITPPGDGTNEDFDLAAEVLSPANRVISKADAEDSDAHELVKTHTLLDLAPGRYLIHLYLQGRMDTADFVLKVSYKTVAAAEQKTDFPAKVTFLPALAMVPLTDDTPASYHKAPPVVVTTHTTHHTTTHTPPTTPVTPPVASATVTARIINIQVSAGGALITVSRGTDSGAQVGMKGVIAGVAGGNFTLAACTPRTCNGVAHITPDQLKGGGNVTLSP